MLLLDFILRYSMNLGAGEAWVTGNPYVNGFEDDGETPINWVAANSVKGRNSNITWLPCSFSSRGRCR